MKASKFYVYELIDPRDGRVFYVGKGTRHDGKNATRLHEHIKETREYAAGRRGRTHKLLKIKKIIDAGLKPVFSIIFNTDIETEISEVERGLIAYYGRLDIKTGILCNHTDGGDGMLGYKHSEKHKTNLRESNPGGIATARSIYQICTRTFKIIASFGSSQQAAIQTVGKKFAKTNIHNAASNKNRTSYGYFWRFVDSYDPHEDLAEQFKIATSTDKGSRPVNQLDGDMVVKTWPSASAICRHYGNNVTTLFRHLKNGDVWNDYRWAYAKPTNYSSASEFISDSLQR